MLQSHKKRLLSNFFSLSALQIFSYILPLITLPYLVRILGVEKFGLISFAQAFMSFFIIFVDYGFNLSATKDISFYRENKNKLVEIYSSVISIKVILTIISFFILLIVIFVFDKFMIDYQIYCFSFFIVIGQALFPVWYFQGIENMKYITILNIVFKTIFTIFIFIFIKKEDDYLLVPIINGIGFILPAIFANIIINAKFKTRFSLQKISTMLQYFKDSFQFFLSRAAYSTYTYFGIFILGIFTNNTIVGYYSIAYKMYDAFKSIYQQGINTIYPYMVKYKNISFFNKCFFASVIINFFMVVILILFSKDIIYLIFKIDNASLVQVFIIFMLSSLLQLPGNLLGYPFLGVFGYFKSVNRTVIYSAIIACLVLFIFCILGMVNVYTIAITVVISESLIFFTRLFICYNRGLLKRSFYGRK